MSRPQLKVELVVEAMREKGEGKRGRVRFPITDESDSDISITASFGLPPCHQEWLWKRVTRRHRADRFGGGGYSGRRGIHLGPGPFDAIPLTLFDLADAAPGVARHRFGAEGDLGAGRGAAVAPQDVALAVAVVVAGGCRQEWLWERVSGGHWPERVGGSGFHGAGEFNSTLAPFTPFTKKRTQ